MAAGDILIAGGGVAEHDGIAAIGIQRAIGLVGDLDAIQARPAIKLQRLPKRNAPVRAEAGIGGWCGRGHRRTALGRLG